MQGGIFIVYTCCDGFFIIETVSVQIQIWLVPDIVKLFRFLYSRLIAENFPAKLTIVLDSCEKYVVVSFIYRESICIFWIFIVNQFCSVKVSWSPVLSLSSLQISVENTPFLPRHSRSDLYGFIRSIDMPTAEGSPWHYKLENISFALVVY